MRRTIRAAVWLAAFAGAVCGELAITDFRMRVALEPGRPVRADIEDAVAFSGVRAADDEALIAGIDRSPASNFQGMLVDLEEGNVASPEYGVSQQNTPIRISTHAPSSGGCANFFKLSLADKAASGPVTIQSRPDAADRAGTSGILEFEFRAIGSAATVSLTLDPGKSGRAENCAGEFYVGPVEYPLMALNSVRFGLNTAKRATFRFSVQPGGQKGVRFETGIIASDVTVRHPDGTMRWDYSARNVKGLSLEGLAIGPGAIELSLSGESLWLDSEAPHLRTWVSQNMTRALLYLALDLGFAGIVVWRLRQRDPVVMDSEGRRAETPPERPYIFVSYARVDIDYVKQLREALHSGGVDVYFDSYLRPGEEWVKKLQTWIENCFAMAIVMTPESTDSKWVTREILLAQSSHRPLLPVLLQSTRNFALEGVHFIDARSADAAPAFLAELRKLGYPFGARAAAQG
jgi:hypothetical protein